MKSHYGKGKEES